MWCGWLFTKLWPAHIITASRPMSLCWLHQYYRISHKPTPANSPPYCDCELPDSCALIMLSVSCQNTGLLLSDYCNKGFHAATIADQRGTRSVQNRVSVHSHTLPMFTQALSSTKPTLFQQTQKQNCRLVNICRRNGRVWVRGGGVTWAGLVAGG